MARLFTLGRFELVEETSASNATPVSQMPMQPKRLALLTYLALSDPGAFHRRDSLLGLLWPELGPDEARRALRQALHHIRRHLGESSLITRSDDQVGLRPGDVWCDAVELERAIRDGRDDDALSIYRGPFLDGVHLADVSTDFEDWVSRTRLKLSDTITQAAWRLSEREELAGNKEAAIEAARRGHALAPHDESGLQRLVRLLARIGDRPGALKAYEDFARRLANDFEVPPSAATQALVADLRKDVAVGSIQRMPNVTAEHTGLSVTPVFSTPLVGQSFRSRRAAAVVAGIALAIGVGGIARFAFGTDAPAPVLAVGWLDNQAGDSAEAMVTTLRGLLATDLARVEGLSVISQSRILEILGQLGRTESAPALGSVAQRAGATELLEGTLYNRAGQLRLELRRVDLERGVVRAVYAAEDSDLYELVDRLTAQLAEAFGNRAPTTPLATTGTGSLAARALYEQGLRSYYRGEWQHAYDHFRTSLVEDSTFAMAAYYAARAGGHVVLLDTVGRLLELAARNAVNAPTRDRLTIRLYRTHAHYATSLAVAESMATMFPNEPVGLLALAEQRGNAGDWLRALPLARRVVTMDSLSLSEKTEMCRACEAFEMLINFYHHLDSLAAAERIAREYVRRRPASPRAWGNLFGNMVVLSRKEDAFAALRRYSELRPGAESFVAQVGALLRFDDHREAERLLRERLERVPEDMDALWWHSIVLRHQGRLVGAAATLSKAARVAPTFMPIAFGQAQVLFEQGEYRNAASIFDSNAHTISDEVRRWPGLPERHLSWTHTHVASALLAAGDTTRVARLADSIEAVAPRSSYGRDWRLPSHVRGLLAQRRGDDSTAVGEFRAAIYSPSHGFSRTNLELARSLLRLGRGREAVPVLQAALRGPNDASGTYATRPEFHDLLGRAFQAIGQRDSAAAHYRLVVDYWSGGDPPFRARADSARMRLQKLR